MSQTLQSVLCITTNKYLVHVLVVLLHARFSVVGPIPFVLAAIFFPVHPYIGSTTVLPDTRTVREVCIFIRTPPLGNIVMVMHHLEEKYISPANLHRVFLCTQGHV